MSRSTELPPHGTNRRYTRGCKCDECCRAHSQARKDWEAKRAQGIELTEDAEPVRLHVLQLIDKGMSLAAVAAKSGLAPARVHSILYGQIKAGKAPCRRLRKADAERLWVVTFDLYAGALVPAIAARRMIQALAWLDISQGEVAKGTGVAESTIGHIADGQRKQVDREIYGRIKRYYEEMRWRKASVGPVHRNAVKSQFAPPWAWGESIEDLTAEPDMDIPPAEKALVETARRNYLSAPDNAMVDAGYVRGYVERELLSRGMTFGVIALQAGMHLSSLKLIMEGSKGRPHPREMRASIARKLLRVRFDLITIGPKGLVDATGSRNRTRALMWMGWSQRSIATEAGLSAYYVGAVASGSRLQVGYRVHRALLGAYDRLRDKVGPSFVSRCYAVRNHYAPPRAWDGVAMNDSAAEPDWGIYIGSDKDKMAAQLRFLCLEGMPLAETSRIMEKSTEEVRLRAVGLGVVFAT